MNKPWIGWVAAGLMLLGGVFELIGGNTFLGVFLMVMGIVSFILRTYFIKKLKDDQNN